MAPCEKLDNSSKLKRKTNGTSRNAKKVKKSNVPSAKELEDIREAEVLFHSCFFKMEVEELLKEVKCNISECALDEWVQKLEVYITNLPETLPRHIDDFPTSIQVPVIRRVPSDKGVFKFVPPQSIEKIGSFMLDTVCSSEPILDIAIKIPKVCWQSMDFMNERYHRKRALYLSYIAESLEKADFVEALKFNYSNNCHLKPNLLIIPQGIENLTISLTAYPAKEAFKLTRFIPIRNNVRPSWLLNKDEDVSDLEIPTPYYNATVLADLLLPVLNAYLKANIVSQTVKDGLILLKIWCIQRGLISGYGRLNGFIISMYLAYLLKKQNVFMNPYQVFRCALFAFQHENFEEGISLAAEVNSQPSLKDFQKEFSNVFIDESGFLNMLYFVNKETVNMMKHEAKLGLKILDSEVPNCFNLLFINKISSLEKFEYLIHMKVPKKFRKYAKKLNESKDNLNFGENKVTPVISKICDILPKGLQNRILLLDVIKNSTSPWPVSEPPPSPNCGQVTIGLLLNPEVPISNLEKGPLADDPQAKEFRKFWGDQSELRRFQDGSIREAVFWPAFTLEDKRKVFTRMVKDILKRHLHVEEKDIVITGTEVDSILHLPKRVLSCDFPHYGTGEEAHITLMQSFNSLSKELRNLTDLPLLISSVQGISPAFHFADVFPPLPLSYFCDESTHVKHDSILKLKEKAGKVPPFMPALKVIISFEGSGKWPDDVEAIKRVKTAFLIKLAEGMKSKYSLVAVPFLTHTDIIKDGYVFRIIIACHKELYLMKQMKMSNGMIKTRETDESRQMELTTEILPKLNSLLHGLHQQHNTFGTACRLAKRWLFSQLKYGYISETTVELLVAYCYCHPEPYTCPSSPQVAFLRFLSLLVNHDWKANPLMINLNNELNKKELEDINSSFTSHRSTLPPMVIITPLDKRGSLWTKNKPHHMILKRIIILAKATLETLNEKLFSMNAIDIKLICRPPLDSYDTVIHLHRHAIPKLRYALDIQEFDELVCLKPYKEHREEIYPVVEYDPVQNFVEELKANFGEFAFFFYDIHGGDCIPVVWKKASFPSKDFKVTDRMCLLQYFRLLGSGIVKDIEKLKD